jgi:hypothetical protein
MEPAPYVTAYFSPPCIQTTAQTPPQFSLFSARKRFMKLGAFEIFLLVVAGLLILFLVLWACEEIGRWWKARHIRKESKRISNPVFYKRN